MQRTWRVLARLSVTLGFAVSACTGGNPVTAPATTAVLPGPAAGCQGNGWTAGVMTATIDGVAWRADCIGAVAGAVNMVVQGLELATSRLVRVTIQPAGGLRAGAFGVGDSLVGDYDGPGGQWRALSQNQGGSTFLSITLSSYGSRRASGIFAFDAPPLTSRSSGTRIVRDGSFEVELP